MGFVEVKKSESNTQQFLELQHFDAPKKEKGFTKLSKRDSFDIKVEAQSKRKLTDFNIPRVTPSEYVLESLESIEEFYVKIGTATVGESRILRLCGHVRYLREILEERKIPYDSNGSKLTELVEHIRQIEIEDKELFTEVIDDDADWSEE